MPGGGGSPGGRARVGEHTGDGGGPAQACSGRRARELPCIPRWMTTAFVLCFSSTSVALVGQNRFITCLICT